MPSTVCSQTVSCLINDVSAAYPGRVGGTEVSDNRGGSIYGSKFAAATWSEGSIRKGNSDINFRSCLPASITKIRHGPCQKSGTSVLYLHAPRDGREWQSTLSLPEGNDRWRERWRCSSSSSSSTTAPNLSFSRAKRARSFPCRCMTIIGSQAIMAKDRSFSYYHRSHRRHHGHHRHRNHYDLACSNMAVELSGCRQEMGFRNAIAADRRNSNRLQSSVGVARDDLGERQGRGTREGKRKKRDAWRGLRGEGITSASFTLRGPSEPIAPFPEDYEELLDQAGAATCAAIEDGKLLLEIEFPPTSLDGVAGDTDGSTEMNVNTRLLRRFCHVFEKGEDASAVRVFFPDAGELELAVIGAGINPNAGQWEIMPVFDDCPFQLDYLGLDSILSEMSYKMMGYKGVCKGKTSVGEYVREEDTLFVIAYPSDSVDEMLLVQDLVQTSGNRRPTVIFNGSLDSIRTGFYPKILNSRLNRLQTEFVPKIEPVYYIHNFKGSRPGVLFRAYPGPWQVLIRDNYSVDVNSNLRCIHTQESMPSLKHVALNILQES